MKIFAWTVLLAATLVLTAEGAPEQAKKLTTAKTDSFTSCKGLSGVFHDPNDCKRYIHCWKNSSYFFRCYDNFVFDPCNKRCVHQDNCIHVDSCNGTHTKEVGWKTQKVGTLSLRPEHFLSSLWEKSHRLNGQRRKEARSKIHDGEPYPRNFNALELSRPREFIQYDEYGEPLVTPDAVAAETATLPAPGDLDQDPISTQAPFVEVEQIYDRSSSAPDADEESHITYLIKVVFNKNRDLKLPPEPFYGPPPPTPPLVPIPLPHFRLTTPTLTTQPQVEIQASFEEFTKQTEKFLDITAPSTNGKSDDISKEQLQTSIENLYSEALPVTDEYTETFNFNSLTSTSIPEPESTTAFVETTSDAAYSEADQEPENYAPDNYAPGESDVLLGSTRDALVNALTLNESSEEYVNEGSAEFDPNPIDHIDLPHMCNISTASQNAVCQCPSEKVIDLMTPTDLAKHCSSLKCRNRGMYLSLSSGHCGCVCPVGFQGDQCQDKSSPSKCDCLNGGRCVAMVNGTFACHCPLGFLGGQCQHNIDNIVNVLASLVAIGQLERGQHAAMDLKMWTLCGVNLCINDGVCLKKMETGERKCFCSDNFCGRNCDRKCTESIPRL